MQPKLKIIKLRKTQINYIKNKMPVKTLQLGKNGVTENFILGMKNYFKNSKSVRVSVLKSCCRNRDELKKINEKILEKLGKNFNSRIIGYVIVLRKFGGKM